MSMTAPFPVDLMHLARYTGGDRSLDSEILELFVRQSAEMMAQLPAILETGDRKRWHLIAHSLKGAARGVGAFEFAEIAAEADDLNPAERPDEARAVADRLGVSMDAVTVFVRDFATPPI